MENIVIIKGTIITNIFEYTVDNCLYLMISLYITQKKNIDKKSNISEANNIYYII